MNEQLNNELQLARQQNTAMSEELTLTKQLVAQLEIKNTRLNQQQAALQQQQQHAQLQRRASVDSREAAVHATARCVINLFIYY